MAGFPSISDPHAALDAQAERIAQQRQQLQQEAQRSYQTAQPQGGMVGKWYVAPSTGSMVANTLGNVAGAALGNYNQSTLRKQLEEQIGAYQQQEQQARQQWLANQPQGQMQELQGPTESGAPLTGMTPPTTQQRMAWLDSGRSIPSLRKTIESAFADQLIQEPQREEARQNRVQDRDTAISAKQQADAAAREARAQETAAARAEREARDLRDQKWRETLEAGRREDRAADRSLRQTIADNMNARLRDQDANKGAGKVSPAATAKADADEALNLLGSAEKLIDKATGSYIGAGVDQLGRAFGKTPKGAAEAGQLKAIEGALIAKMPKMSGPQSDRDVQLYRDMAGQVGDPTVPAPIKKAAIQSIREIQRRYASNGGADGSWDNAPAGGQPQAPVRVNTPAEAARLPKGTQFITPDGQLRVRQ